MQNNLYLASTYLKVVARSDLKLVEQLHEILGERAQELLESDYTYAHDIRTIFSAFESAGMQSWLLRYGEQLDVASHGTLGFAVLSAPDLETAMNVLAEFFVIRSSAYDCEFTYVGNRAEFVIQDLTNDPTIGRWLIETGFRVIQQLIESVMAHPLGDHATIHFACSEPHYRRELTEFYGVPCEFDQAQHKISIPASWCRIRSPLYDQTTFRSNLAKCQELKLRLAGNTQTKAAVALQFDNFFNSRSTTSGPRHQLPNLADLANDLNMSTRTLSRKLADEQTSYKILLETARKNQACYLLQNTHLSIADVAYNLAYQEPANFVRAFKIWFNTTPAAWRRASKNTDNERTL